MVTSGGSRGHHGDRDRLGGHRERLRRLVAEPVDVRDAQADGVRALDRVGVRHRRQAARGVVRAVVVEVPLVERDRRAAGADGRARVEGHLRAGCDRVRRHAERRLRLFLAGLRRDLDRPARDRARDRARLVGDAQLPFAGDRLAVELGEVLLRSERAEVRRQPHEDARRRVEERRGAHVRARERVREQDGRAVRRSQLDREVAEVRVRDADVLDLDHADGAVARQVDLRDDRRAVHRRLRHVDRRRVDDLGRRAVADPRGVRTDAVVDRRAGVRGEGRGHGQRAGCHQGGEGGGEAQGRAHITRASASRAADSSARRRGRSFVQRGSSIGPGAHRRPGARALGRRHPACGVAGPARLPAADHAGPGLRDCGAASARPLAVSRPRRRRAPRAPRRRGARPARRARGSGRRCPRTRGTAPRAASRPHRR